MIDSIGILLVVAAIALLMNRQQSVVIGATQVIPAGQFTYRRELPSKSKSTPQQRSQSTGGGVGGPSTKQKYDTANRQQAARNQWARVSDIPPATRKKIVNTWITRARKLAAAKLAAILNAKRGYQRVGYSGGFGGTIAPTVPGVTGAIGANAYSAYEEALGLKPAGEPKAVKKMSNTANGAIQDFINCKNNKACRAAAVRKFDQIIVSNATSAANGLPQLRGQFDPTQSAV